MGEFGQRSVGRVTGLLEDFQRWGGLDTAQAQLTWFYSELCGAEERRKTTDQGSRFWGLMELKNQGMAGRVTEQKVRPSAAGQAFGRPLTGNKSEL